MEEITIYRKVITDKYMGLLASTFWFYSLAELEKYCEETGNKWTEIEEDTIISYK